MYPNHLLKETSSKTPGIVPMLLFAPKQWFNVIQVPQGPFTNGIGETTITQTHTFLPNPSGGNYGFIQLELSDRTGEVTLEETGEIDSEGVDALVSGFAPGLNQNLLSLLGKSLDAIVLVQDLTCSNVRYHQLGTSCSVAYKQGWKYTSGKAGGEGRKGTEVKFMAYMEQALIYTGEVSLADQPDQGSN
jgi:hypothetical protein